MEHKVLFGYPIEATEENWLHESLCEILTTIHDCLDYGKELPSWPDIIPSKYRKMLDSRTGLQSRIDAYAKAVSTLSKANRGQVLTCLTDQNDIENLLSCSCSCNSISDLAGAIQEPVKELFDFAFRLLTSVGVRDTHYHAIYNSTSYHVCPFCGFEYFDAPGAPREDLDHYLPKSRYPFAAANLRNLVPMGMKCNERYKQATDILVDDVGNRRRAFDPYKERELRVVLDGSLPFEGSDGGPKWQIEFLPTSPECTTWDDVFMIRERIRRDVLEPSWNSWLWEFHAWCASSPLEVSDDCAVIDGIERYAGYLRELGYNDRAFLKWAVFSMLLKCCRNGDRRLLDLMRDLVVVA